MSRRILVADDSSTIQKVIKIAFARHHVEIVEASSFIEALASVVRQGPDLIVVDASLPGAKGPEDFAKLAKGARDAPVLLLFGSYDAVDEALFRQAGFPHTLKKPFESGDLVALADRLLGGQLTQAVPARDMPSMPPAPDQPRAAGRQAHTTVIYEPGTISLDVHAAPMPPPAPGRATTDRVAPPPPPGRTMVPAPAIPSIPELDLDELAPSAEESLAPRVLTDETKRGRRAFVPEPPLDMPRPPSGRSPVHAPPPEFSAAGLDDEADLEAELVRMGVAPPSPPTYHGSAATPTVPGRGDSGSVELRNPELSGSMPGSRTLDQDFDRGLSSDLARTPDFTRSPDGSRGSFAPDRDRGGTGNGPLPFSAGAARAPAISDEQLRALLDERLPSLARQTIEDYCERHFKSLARDIIATELRRLADEKARHLVDN